MRLFLKECKISENFLASWNEDESKREFLTRLFDALPRTQIGRNALIKIADFLSEQQTFPDLQNWEDSEKKIQDAHISVDRLRTYNQKQVEELVDNEEQEAAKTRFRVNQQKVSASQVNIAQLNTKLSELVKQLGTQKGGYLFQDWFYELMDFYEIQNRKPYTHDGRQIDGSITLFGTTYLVELKFTSNQSDATDMDTFYKKVTTKADNTMGIMVSISGYSSVAIKEASGSRTPLLLFDHAHIYMALSGVMSFTEIVDRVRRHASQTGEAFLSVKDFTS
ncbi:MAG: hypothetical protein ACM3O3_10800 [Syntrophothermus sp.]